MKSITPDNTRITDNDLMTHTSSGNGLTEPYQPSVMKAPKPSNQSVYLQHRCSFCLQGPLKKKSIDENRMGQDRLRGKCEVDVVRCGLEN